MGTNFLRVEGLKVAILKRLNKSSATAHEPLLVIEGTLAGSKHVTHAEDKRARSRVSCGRVPKLVKDPITIGFWMTLYTSDTNDYIVIPIVKISIV